MWINLLEKEKVREIKLSSEGLDSDVFSNSDDNFDNDELWQIHLDQEHNNVDLGDETDNLQGYVLLYTKLAMYIFILYVHVYQHVIRERQYMNFHDRGKGQ